MKLAATGVGISGICILLLIAGCSDHSDRFAALVPTEFPATWAGIDDYEPCYLKVNRERRPSIRVNCFTINGVLHTHSHRFVDFYHVFGESWVYTVARDKSVSVLIQNRLYNCEAHRIVDVSQRQEILKNRNYDLIPDGIQVFMLLDRPSLKR